MTMVILPHAHFDVDHLEKVRAEMALLGSPRIRAFDCGDHMIAVEGSHRLRAAAMDGVPVDLVVLDGDGTIDLSTLDIDDNGWFEGERVVPVADLMTWWTKDGFPMDTTSVEVEAA